MIRYNFKPDWTKAFPSATHLLQVPFFGNDYYVFATCIDGDFYHNSCANDCYSNFTVVEERPELIMSNCKVENTQDIGVVITPTKLLPSYKQSIGRVKRVNPEAQGIRKAVAHLKETHGGDRFSSSAYLSYADELENAIS